MRAICLYLHIHQPVRYREYSIFDVSNDSNYFNDQYTSRQSNERIFKKVAEKSYRPMLDLLEKNMHTIILLFHQHQTVLQLNLEESFFLKPEMR